MKLIKTIVVSVVIGIAVGMWFGVNIGHDEPFYANPFNAHTLNQKLKSVTGETLEKGGHALEQTGQKLQDKMKQ